MIERKFFVPGMPATKGSTRSFYNPKARKVVTMADNRESQKQWEGRVSALARQARAPYVVGTAVSVSIEFMLPRPKAHFGSGKNAGRLKSTADVFPTKKPDVDKLVRAVLDALTGVAYKDDAQVIRVDAGKKYLPAPGAIAGAQVTIRYHGDTVHSQEGFALSV